MAKISTKPEISVIIATRNRRTKLLRCLDSIVSCGHKSYEIIVVDQSDKRIHSGVLDKYGKPLKYYWTKNMGKSKALNFGIEKSRSDILAFTDDDCVVDQGWLDVITRFFKREKKAGGILGNVFPCEPERHLGEICLAIINIRSHKVALSELNYVSIGLGNNMAFRRNLFIGSGTFVESIGPGSNLGALGSEDTEIIYRLIKAGQYLIHSTKSIVYHDNWMDYSQSQRLLTKYVISNFVLFSYYLLAKNDTGMYIHTKHWWSVIILGKIRDMLKRQKSFSSLKWNLKETQTLIKLVLAAILGLGVGVSMAIGLTTWKVGSIRSNGQENSV